MARNSTNRFQGSADTATADPVAAANAQREAVRRKALLALQGQRATLLAQGVSGVPELTPEMGMSDIAAAAQRFSTISAAKAAGSPSPATAPVGRFTTATGQTLSFPAGQPAIGAPPPVNDALGRLASPAPEAYPAMVQDAQAQNARNAAVPAPSARFQGINAPATAPVVNRPNATDPQGRSYVDPTAPGYVPQGGVLPGQDASGRFRGPAYMTTKDIDASIAALPANRLLATQRAGGPGYGLVSSGPIAGASPNSSFDVKPGETAFLNGAPIDPGSRVTVPANGGGVFQPAVNPGTASYTGSATAKFVGPDEAARNAAAGNTSGGMAGPTFAPPGPARAKFGGNPEEALAIRQNVLAAYPEVGNQGSYANDAFNRQFKPGQVVDQQMANNALKTITTPPAPTATPAVPMTNEDFNSTLARVSNPGAAIVPPAPPTPPADTSPLSNYVSAPAAPTPPSAGARAATALTGAVSGAADTVTKTAGSVASNVGDFYGKLIKGDRTNTMVPAPINDALGSLATPRPTDTPAAPAQPYQRPNPVGMSAQEFNNTVAQSGFPAPASAATPPEDEEARRRRLGLAGR